MDLGRTQSQNEQTAFFDEEDDEGDQELNDDERHSNTFANGAESDELTELNLFGSPASVFRWNDLLHRIWHPLMWFRSKPYERLNAPRNHRADVSPKLPSGSVEIFWHSLSSILLSSKLNLSIVFVPIGLASYMLQAPPVAVFVTNGIAIVPLSALLTDATERIASDVGDTIGALLNITLGNLVELILLVALKDGHTRIVEASILGSILVNILLILGSALLVCSVFDTQDFRPTASSQILGCLLFVSVFAFLIPTAFQSAFDSVDETHSATLKMSRITACIVLMIYLLYMFHELRSPKETEKTAAAGTDVTADVESRLPSSQGIAEAYPMQPYPKPFSQLGLPPRSIRFAEESRPNTAGIEHGLSHREGESSILFDASQEEGVARSERRTTQEPPSAYRSSYSRTRPGRSASLGSTQVPLISEGLETLDRRFAIVLPTMRSMRPSLDDPSMNRAAERNQNRKHSRIDRAVCVLILFVTSGLMSMNAEFLVSTIDQITHKGHLSEAIIGLIILPIVGNMAEYITVVTVAVRDNLDLAVAVSVGSSIQIALCVAPLTVLAGWLLDRDLLLTFNFFEMATLMGTILLVNIIALTGVAGGSSSSNALRGGLICGCYAIIAVGAYLDPETD